MCSLGAQQVEFYNKMHELKGCILYNMTYMNSLVFYAPIKLKYFAYNSTTKNVPVWTLMILFCSALFTKC